MRIQATQSSNDLRGHVYYFAFKSVDSSLAFCCSQIPALHLTCVSPQPNSAPVSPNQRFP